MQEDVAVGIGFRQVAGADIVVAALRRPARFQPQAAGFADAAEAAVGAADFDGNAGKRPADAVGFGRQLFRRGHQSEACLRSAEQVVQHVPPLPERAACDFGRKHRTAGQNGLQTAFLRHGIQQPIKHGRHEYGYFRLFARYQFGGTAGVKTFGQQHGAAQGKAEIQRGDAVAVIERRGDVNILPLVEPQRFQQHQHRQDADARAGFPPHDAAVAARTARQYQHFARGAPRKRLRRFHALRGGGQFAERYGIKRQAADFGGQAVVDQQQAGIVLPKQRVQLFGAHVGIEQEYGHSARRQRTQDGNGFGRVAAEDGRFPPLPPSGVFGQCGGIAAAVEIQGLPVRTAVVAADGRLKRMQPGGLIKQGLEVEAVPQHTEGERAQVARMQKSCLIKQLEAV